MMKLSSLLPYALAVAVAGCSPAQPRQPCQPSEQNSLKCVESQPGKYELFLCDSEEWALEPGLKTVFKDEKSCRYICSEFEGFSRGYRCLTKTAEASEAPKKPLGNFRGECEPSEKGKAKCIGVATYYLIADCDGEKLTDRMQPWGLPAFGQLYDCKKECSREKNCITPLTEQDKPKKYIEVTSDTSFTITVPPKGSPVGPAEIKVIPKPTSD